MKNVNLEEILDKVYDDNYRNSFKTDYSKQCILSAMKEACRQVLELAAENANIGMKKKSAHGKYRKWQKTKLGEEVDLFSYQTMCYVDKESILNTINQVI